MTLLERNTGIAYRIGHLSPIAEQVRSVLLRGKAEQLDAGVTAAGAAFAPLAASTLRERPGGGPPLGGSSGKIGRAYTVEVTVTPAKLTAAAGWPGLPWIGAHIRGTRTIPRRDPSGFRAEDLAQCMGLLRGHVFGNG